MHGIYEHLRKNRKKIICLASIIGGSYIALKITRYLQSNSKKYQVSNSLDFKIRKAQYFQSMLNNALDTIENILKNVENEIESSVDIENVAKSLGFIYVKTSQSVEYNKQQYASLSADEKLELLNKFKVISFTKLTLLMYSWAFLCISIHIQMSILAGKIFQSQNTSGYLGIIISKFYEIIFPSTKVQFKPIDEKPKLEFLNSTLKLLKSQIPDWSNIIHKSSAKVIEPMSLKQMLTSENVLDIFDQIKNEVHSNILEMFINKIQLQTSCKPIETDEYALFANIFESSGVEHLNQFISVLSQQISSSLNRKINSLKRNDDKLETVGKIPLAKLVPFIWTSFINESNNISLFNSIRGYFETPQFRFMLFNSYENSIDLNNKN